MGNKKHVKVFIHDLWWTDLLKVRVRVPKKYRYFKSLRTAYTDGVADGVAASLNALEAETSATVTLEDR